MFVFNKREVAPIQAPGDHILKWMLQSGAYMPAAVWVLSPQGRGLNPEKFDSLWQLIRDSPESADIKTVRNLFLDWNAREDQLAQPNDRDWDYDY
mmetsp:Transcript_18584/g.56110  ORF Transcript_18584/g.56110 Transcript_18584/m.56110 type:complete len:95 (-) Transcript_18584:1327-1611(-)